MRVGTGELGPPASTTAVGGLEPLKRSGHPWATCSTRLCARIGVAPAHERRTMPEYAPGTPSWVELSTPDTDAAADFYRELMGWSATESGAAENGGARM